MYFRIRMSRVLSIFLLLLFTVVLTVTASTPKIKNRLWQYKTKHFNYYSLQDEIEIGERFMADQKKAFEKKKLRINPVEYEPIRKRIDAIVKRLAAVSDIPKLPYEVVIFEKDDVPNAYCLPGGKIGVFTGIFDKDKGLIDKNSDDQIAAVLGHEIAHATLRHVTRRLTTYNSLGLIGSVVSLGVGRGLGQNWGYLADQVFSTGTFLYLPSYSRKHEKEADKVGFYYMTKAGFNPQAAIDVWIKAAQQKSKQSGNTKTSFFDSHPASGERATYLKLYLPDALEVQKQVKINQEIRQ